MPPPPPNRPLTAPARAPEIPIRPRFTGITSVEYVRRGAYVPLAPPFGGAVDAAD